MADAAFDLPTHEIQAFTEAFSVLDKDGKGQISTEKLKAFLATMGQIDPTMAQVKEFVDPVDVEKKGGINFPQFLKLMETNKGDEVQEAIGAFALFKTEEAPVTAAQMHTVCQNLGQDITIEEVQSMIKTISGGKDSLDFPTFKKLFLTDCSE